jgi:hypothetical protein
MSIKYFLTLQIFISFIFAETPSWLFLSEDSSYIYGVGSAKRDISFSKQLKVAKILARANLSENISVNVESNFEKRVSSDNRSEVSYSTSQTSSHLLKYSFIKNRWVDDSGELFILMAVPKEKLATD